eukprot:2332913-Pyramimonas_sp.AAC.1
MSPPLSRCAPPSSPPLPARVSIPSCSVPRGAPFSAARGRVRPGPRRARRWGARRLERVQLGGLPGALGVAWGRPTGVDGP